MTLSFPYLAVELALLPHTPVFARRSRFWCKEAPPCPRPPHNEAGCMTLFFRNVTVPHLLSLLLA